MQQSKVLVPLFLQVLKYNERGGREKGRGKGKWKKKGEGRKENEIKTPIEDVLAAILLRVHSLGFIGL